MSAGPAHLSPEALASLPRHVAIIMDGNGRWAKERHLPRVEGHREGAESGRVMAIALHPYLTGVPYRIDAFDAALAYICRHPRVWRATGSEIARHYRAQGKA